MNIRYPRLTWIGATFQPLHCASITLLAALAAIPAGAAEIRPSSHDALYAAGTRIAAGLVRGDLAAVQGAVAEAILTLGGQAGVPETPTHYYPPIDTTPVPMERARAAWLAEVDRGLRGLPWEKNPEGDPKRMQAGLREVAGPLSALARTALYFPEQRVTLTKHVCAGADWLLARQHATGVFPFPIGPGLKPREKVGKIVARAIAEHPEIVVNGWISDDLGDGGLQFDNGLCGNALLDAWRLTGDIRYLDAARRSGAWAITSPLVVNWNYNAFSAGFLARLSTATGDATYLDAAVSKATLGVLPGQMSSGRWFDPHNACAVYHNILMRELLAVFHALPNGHPGAFNLRDALTRGLDQAAEETARNGYTGTWTANFACGIAWIGERPSWRDALNVNLNGSGKSGAPSAGMDLLAVLEVNGIKS